MALRHLVLVAAAVAGALAGCGAQVRPAAPTPSGTLFVVDSRRSDRVFVIDAGSGRTHAVRPPGVAQCGPGLYATGGRIVYVGSTSRSSRAYVVDPHKRGSRTSLGGAHELVPSDTPGRVWLHTVPRCRNVKRINTLREVTLDGRVTQRSRGRVPGFQLIGAIEDGLVMFGRSSAVVAWDPAADHVIWTRTGASVVATGGRLIAWRAHGDDDRIHVTDVKRARTRAIKPPAGLSFSEVYQGALSPGRSLLAVSAKGSRARYRLVLVDLRTGVADSPGGAQMGDPSTQAVAWSSSGWVFFQSKGGRLMAYRPGERSAMRVPAKLKYGVSQMAAD